MAAVKVAARASVVMVETTPAAIGDGVQRPAVLAYRVAAGGRTNTTMTAAMTAATAAMMARVVRVTVAATRAQSAGREARHGARRRSGPPSPASNQSE